MIKANSHRLPRELIDVTGVHVASGANAQLVHVKIDKSQLDATLKLQPGERIEVDAIGSKQGSARAEVLTLRLDPHSATFEQGPKGTKRAVMVFSGRVPNGDWQRFTVAVHPAGVPYQAVKAGGPLGFEFVDRT